MPVSNTSVEPSSRNRFLKNTPNNEYDLVVIGGGIAGAGIARDAAMRGFKTLVVGK